MAGEASSPTKPRSRSTRSRTSTRRRSTSPSPWAFACNARSRPISSCTTPASPQELIFIDSLTNTLQLKNYFRFDLKLAYRINSSKNKVSHEFALDLVNLLNTKNILGLSYAPNPTDPAASPVREEYQLGFLPLFYYKIDF